MIRLATKDDLHEISRLWVMMVNELKKEWTPDPEGWVNISKELLGTGTHEIAISIEDNKIVGFLQGIVFYDPSISKKRSVGQYFFVLPEYRNTSVAESLYEEILVQSLKNGSDSLELFCLPDMEEYWNKRGFKKDQLLMRMVI